MYTAYNNNGGTIGMTTSQDSKLTSLYNTLISDNTLVQTDLLWTNTTQQSSFAAQTVTLDLTNYIGVLISAFNYSTTSIANTFTYVSKNMSTGIACCWISDAMQLGMGRKVTVSNTGVTFAIGNAYAGAGYETSDRDCIPYKIYGVKVWNP